VPRKNPNQRKSKSKFADGFRVSSEAIVCSDNEQEKEFGEGVGLPRVHGAPILFAIARDPRTIFTYWSIDWPAVFAKTVPVDRQAHLRVYRADGVEEESVAVEPMSGNCSIAVSRPSGSYHVEIGYYQPADVWNSIATSKEVTMPRDSFAGYGDVDPATIPFHLSFQRLLDLFGASKGDALAEMISQFQKRALNNEKRKQLSDKEREILRAMGLSLSEIAAARRAFIDHANTETLRKRTEALVGFASSSPARGFGESSWSSSTA
jgi:DNA-binding CsgD family transcriptional regulator